MVVLVVGMVVVWPAKVVVVTPVELVLVLVEVVVDVLVVGTHMGGSVLMPASPSHEPAPEDAHCEQHVANEADGVGASIAHACFTEKHCAFVQARSQRLSASLSPMQALWHWLKQLAATPRMHRCWQLQSPDPPPDCSGTAVAASSCGATLATAAPGFVLQFRLHCLSCRFAVWK